MNFDFIPMNFIQNLKYMGIGMLGIFVVIGIIAITTIILNKICSKKSQKNDKAE